MKRSEWRFLAETFDDIPQSRRVRTSFFRYASYIVYNKYHVIKINELLQSEIIRKISPRHLLGIIYEQRRELVDER